MSGLETSTVGRIAIAILLVLSWLSEAEAGCASQRLAALIGQKSAARSRDAVAATGRALESSQQFMLYRRDAGLLPLGPDTLTPRKSYTTVTRNGKIVIGEDIAGVGESTAGTHVTMLESIGKSVPRSATDGLPYRGGSFRVNADGSVDVSGYHLQCIQPSACREAADELVRYFEAAGVRVRMATPDRLPPPSD